MTTARGPTADRLSAAKLWLPAVRELEARLPERVAALCDRAGLPRGDFEDPRKRIPLRAATRLLRDATKETGEPLFGMLAGRKHARETYDAFMRLLIAQPDLDTALTVARRFTSLPIEGLEVSYHEHGAAVRVDITLDGLPLSDPYLTEYVLGVITELITDAGDPRLRLLEAEVVHEPRADRRAYRGALGADVRFGSERTAIVLPHLNIPLPHADPVLATLLSEHASLVLGTMPAATSHRDRVAGVIVSRLDDESLGIGDVARALGMSTRTLRRRLEEESTTFAALLDDARRERALEMLAHPGRTVSEVSVAVGFASAGAFRRAFQRWTGTSASSYRARSGGS